MPIRSLMRLLAIPAIVLLTQPTWAIDEDFYRLLYPTVVEPWCDANRVTGTFAGVDDVSVSYAIYETDASRGALVILPGLPETYLQYCELAYDMREAGYRIYVLDHRGNGLSDHLLPDTRKAHVVSFNDYVDDAKTFVDTIVAPEHDDEDDQIVAIGHSLGGAVLAVYAQRYPDEFDAMVLSSPAFEINTAPIPFSIAYLIASALTLSGQGEEYAPTQGSVDPNTLRFVGNKATHSRMRYNYLVRDVWQDNTMAWTSGVTNQWIREAIEGGILGIRRIELFATPILMLEAERDRFVKTDALERACDRAAICELRLFPGTFHSLLLEKDATRDQILDAMLAFFYNPPPPRAD